MIRMLNPSVSSPNSVQVGLVVAFAALDEVEQRAVEATWQCAVASATHWKPAIATFGLDPVSEQARNVDILVYLGESSRFDGVAGEAAQRVPVVFVKSTVEELLIRPPDAAPRYRMCTGVRGIAWALASVAPMAPTVDWKTLPWPNSVRDLTELDEAELSYVNTSVEAFREAAEKRDIPWVIGLPGGDETFSVFLTMHDPTAAVLAEKALRLWPQCTVLAADGMVSSRAPSGQRWPEQLARVRHWSSHSHSKSNDLFREAMGNQPLPDFDSAGMLFGTMNFLDSVFAAGGQPRALESAGTHPGPLGPLRMTTSGRPLPERIMIFHGEQSEVLTVE